MTYISTSNFADFLDDIRGNLKRGIEMLEEAYKTDAKQVHCRDCEHSYYASNRAPEEQCWACDKHGIDVTENWYCADGIRRVSE